MFVTESWLTSKVLDTELLCQEYAIIRKDRVAKRGGGVLIAVKSNMFRSVYNLLIPAAEDLELVSAVVETYSGQRILKIHLIIFLMNPAVNSTIC